MTEHRTCLLLLFFHQTWATPVTWGRLNLVKVFKLYTRNSSSYLKADFEKNTLPGLVIHQNNVFVLLRIVQDYFYILLMFCYIQCFLSRITWGERIWPCCIDSRWFTESKALMSHDDQLLDSEVHMHDQGMIKRE